MEVDKKRELKPVLIVGPTAVGKTKLSVELACLYGGEILSADSMQIYRGMDIGTAKATLEEQQGIPHWGLDLIEPDALYTVAEFQKYARAVLEDLKQRNKLPIVVGGTGLYVKALIEPMDFTPAKENPELRAQLYKRIEREGSETLHRELAVLDSVSANRIHPNDAKRIVRALEVYYQTGKPMSQSYAPETEGSIVIPSFVMIGLTMSDRDRLYQAINRRVDQMIEQGLVEEVKRLWQSGIARSTTSMQAIGYKEITEYLEGRMSLEAAVESVKQNSRRLAKRQLSWFRRDPRIHWLYTDTCSWDQVVQNARATIEGKSCSQLE